MPRRRARPGRSPALFEARAAPPTPHAEPFPAKDAEERSNMRTNFLALVLSMLGTAGMPHILMRSYTTPSVSEARRSVCWSPLFILLLYFMAPALALLVKYEVYTQVVGSNFLSLPNWVHAWSAVDSNLLDVTDINRDGIVQLGEISMGADVVVLAMPEIGGLPYVISGLVAAGGLAAALSTADGLLLTLSNSLSHDMWYRVVSPRMPAARRVMASKILLLAVAFGAAWVAARKPADILFMVSAAFSFAASSFFPALVMGVFWRRANKWGRRWAWRRAAGHVLLHDTHPALAARMGAGHLAQRADHAVVGHSAHRRRRVRRAGGLPDHHRGVAADPPPTAPRWRWSITCASVAGAAGREQLARGGCCGAQWETDFEKTFITTTPAMMRPMPIIAGASRCCLKSSALTMEMSTMPTPDQIA